MVVVTEAYKETVVGVLVVIQGKVVEGHHLVAE
jgi:hypothetical protein